jgi:hypothetical protein
MNLDYFCFNSGRQTVLRLAGLASLTIAATMTGCGGGGGAGGAGGGTAVANSCTSVSKPSSGLIISEVSTNSGNNAGPWFEVYNASPAAIDISAYTMRAGSSTDAGDVQSTPMSFALPAVTVQPGQYLVIAGVTATVTNPVNAQGVVYVSSANRFPHWQDSGFIELVKNGATQDAVRFGTSTAVPTSSCGWVGNNIAALPSSSVDFGRSIVRQQATIGTNTNSAADWTLVNFTTPGGPNDVPPDAVDADNDGIPDSAEVPGGHYAGLDLYAMGARVNQPDIFVQIDHMGPASSGDYVGHDWSWTPQKASLDMVKAAFAKHGIAVHFDVGNVFSEPVGTGYNLGQGSTVPFSEIVYFNLDSNMTPLPGAVPAFQYKMLTMPATRRNIFHYVLFGFTNQMAPGQAELNGNDLVVAIGKFNSTPSPTTWFQNTQAEYLMHELGHNLGLRHGGFEDRTYKPNYVSTMNYLYGDGIPVSLTANSALQPWLNVVRNNYFTDFAGSDRRNDFVLDYSDGSSKVLDGTALVESDLIGRGADPGAYADWNNNGVLDVAPYAVATALTSLPGLLDPQGAQPMKDYNDWANLKLAFSRHLVGTSTILSLMKKSQRATDSRFESFLSQGFTGSSFDPISNDKQTVITETPHGFH